MADLCAPHNCDRRPDRRDEPIMRITWPVLAALSLAACADDPLRYSEPVSINLKAKSADTVGGVVTDEKGITTESGNPYGQFVNDARAQIGREPGRIDLDAASLTLGANSTGVTRLGEVFTGDVDVLFAMNDSNNAFIAGGVRVDATDGGGPLSMTVLFDSAAIGADDYGRLLAGSFKVSVRGDAATGFETKGADADLQITLTFAAYE